MEQHIQEKYNWMLEEHKMFQREVEGSWLLVEHIQLTCMRLKHKDLHCKWEELHIQLEEEDNNQRYWDPEPFLASFPVHSRKQVHHPKELLESSLLVAVIYVFSNN
jgi:hypothetical protein